MSQCSRARSRNATTALMIFAFLHSASLASAALSPGDIAIIGYQSTDPDALAFVALAPIAGGEVIRMTDSGWQAAGGFRANEGGIQYTVPSGGLAAGTVVSRANPFTSGDWSANSTGLGSSGFALSTSGDQILVFQGAATSPLFIYAINNSTTGWSDATSSNTTALPPGLTDGDTAVNIGAAGRANGYYSGATSGTAAQLRAAIGNPANWTTSASLQTWPPWNFSVSGGGPLPPTVYAGADRTLLLGGGAITIVMTDATANDVNGLSGLTYAWTPATAPGITSWTNRTGPVADPSSPSEAQVTINAIGTYTFTLSATNASSLTSSDDVVINVTNAPPIGQYDPPAAYYDPARPGGQWLTGAALKSALAGIIGNHVVRSYDAARQSLQILDLDPANTNNLILIYTGNSVPKIWDSGVTWNREHQWPQSLFPSGTPMTSDEFHLRPADPVVNSTRGDKPYGIGAGYWDPNQGGMDRGDCARALFYCATRYSSISLVNGMPGANQMGDLARLIQWHFEDPVSNTERRRNHLIYSSVDNPSYYQGNRNPFIDYPELVWTIFSGVPNDAEIFLGQTPPANGDSNVSVNFGRIIVGAALPPAQVVTLNKTGSSPTTYNVTLAGAAASAVAGPRQAFASSVQSRLIDVSIAGSTGSAAHLTGTMTIDNTELTSAGPGQGSADGNDVVMAALDVVAHSNASFASGSDQNSLTIDFGSVAAGSGVQTRSFAITNLESAAGLTAGLRLDAIGGTGQTATLYTDLATFTNVPAGTSRSFVARFDTTTPGTFNAVYTLTVSDESLPGATAGPSLILTLIGQATATCTSADVNCDGQINDADVAPFVALLLGGGPPCSSCAGDGTGDQLIDGADVAPFVAALIHP